MNTVTLILPKSFGRLETLQRLTEPDSGFAALQLAPFGDVDTRAPLASAIEIGISLAGLIVSGAQLAIAIADLRRSAKRDAKDAPPQEVVVVVWPDGHRAEIPADDDAALKRELSARVTESKESKKP